MKKTNLFFPCCFASWGASALRSLSLFHSKSKRFRACFAVSPELPTFFWHFCQENVQPVIHFSGERWKWRPDRHTRDTSRASAGLHFSRVASGYLTWHRRSPLAGVTDTSANNGGECSSPCCQRWFINHSVCISISVLIWPGRRLLSRVLVLLFFFSPPPSPPPPPTNLAR